MQKALSSGSRVVVLMNSDAGLKTMSDALWTSDPTGFLPHGMPREALPEAQPIILTLADENPNRADILCVLDGGLPESVPTYKKILDVFDGSDETQVASARARWSHYKAQGYALQYIKQQPGGGWKNGNGIRGGVSIYLTIQDWCR